MIRKYIYSALLGISLFGATAYGSSVTTTVVSGGFVNLLPGWSQPIDVQQIQLAAPTNGSVSTILIDTPTNVMTYVSPAYTNTISYATNSMITAWTNFYGVVQTYTNFNLIDLTNNLVAASTNNYPSRISLSASTGTTVSTYGPINYYFNNGIWATNGSSYTETITITYH